MGSAAGGGAGGLGGREAGSKEAQMGARWRERALPTAKWELRCMGRKGEWWGWRRRPERRALSLQSCTKECSISSRCWNRLAWYTDPLVAAVPRMSTLNLPPPPPIPEPLLDGRSMSTRPDWPGQERW